MKISERNKLLTNSILKKVEPDRERGILRTVSFPKLFRYFNKEEKKILEEILKINPKNFGFNGQFYGISPVPRNLIPIENQKYKFKGKIEKINKQFLPKPAYLAYQKMNQRMMKDLNKILLIESGYRSPAYQLIIFLDSLKYKKFNLEKTIKWAALPGYSEHGTPKRQAVDFVTMDGAPQLDALSLFERTKEFKWLMQNANKFGFYLSYPKNNKDGVIYEPWHWHFEKNI